MSQRDAFESVCAAVCASRGWQYTSGRIDVGVSGERSQGISVEFFEFEGQEFARFFTTIGSIEHINALRLVNALRVNFGLPHGAMAVRDSDLVIVDTLMVSRPDPHEIASMLNYLGEIADHFEKSFFGTDRH